MTILIKPYILGTQYFSPYFFYLRVYQALCKVSQHTLLGWGVEAEDFITMNSGDERLNGRATHIICQLFSLKH